MGHRQPVLSVQNLKKSIKGKPIIKGVSFDVFEGEVFGFLGPNGSGKTTTIRMLVDLIRPTEGTIRIGGKDIRKHHGEALAQIGSIVENPELYPYLTGYENLQHFAGMLKDVGAERIAEVVDIVGMDNRIHDKVKTYSLGMRQRLGIAQALLGNPRLLILDEPTNGLDPQGIKELRAFIRSLADQGMSVFVSSHLLSEIQLMCDRVAIIRKGEVIAVGEVSELVGRAAGYVQWAVSDPGLANSLIDSIEGIDRIPAPDATAATAHPHGSSVFTTADAERIPELTRRLVEAGVQIYAIEAKNPTLEDLFLHLTEGETID